MDDRSVSKSIKITAGATSTQWVCSTWLLLLVHKGHNSHSCLTYALYPAQKAIQYVWMSSLARMECLVTVAMLRLDNYS